MTHINLLYFKPDYTKNKKELILFWIFLLSVEVNVKTDYAVEDYTSYKQIVIDCVAGLA